MVIVQLDVKRSTTLRRCSSAGERLKHRRLPFIPFGTTRRWLSAHNREVVGSKPTAGIRLSLCDAKLSFFFPPCALETRSVRSHYHGYRFTIFCIKNTYLPQHTTRLIHFDALCLFIPSPYLLRRQHVIHHATR